MWNRITPIVDIRFKFQMRGNFSSGINKCGNIRSPLFPAGYVFTLRATTEELAIASSHMNMFNLLRQRLKK